MINKYLLLSQSFRVVFPYILLICNLIIQRDSSLLFSAQTPIPRGAFEQTRLRAGCVSCCVSCKIGVDCCVSCKIGVETMPEDDPLDRLVSIKYSSVFVCNPHFMVWLWTMLSWIRLWNNLIAKSMMQNLWVLLVCLAEYLSSSKMCCGFRRILYSGYYCLLKC
jgi:hypothetical protein